MGKPNYNGYKSNAKYTPKKDVYSGAPYNFVTLSRKVIRRYDTEGELPSHNKIYGDRYSGEICYTISAYSPIFISNGKKEENEVDFYKNLGDKYAVPGSSIRGLIRNNIQILSSSAVGNDIDDNTLMYRSVASSRGSVGLLKGEYNNILGVKPTTIQTKDGSKTISVSRNVRAGYISKEGEKYYIYETVVKKINDTFGNMNYYPVRKTNGLDNVLVKDDKRPFYKQVYYELSGERNIKLVTTHTNKDDNLKKGYIHRSGFMNGKKVLYIIPEIDESSKIEISKKDILAFKHDYEMKVNQLTEKKFFSLPDEGEKRPVFYIKYDGRLYFGYTPYLRLFHKYSIKDGIFADHKNDEIIDYAKSMFGYSNEKSSYKSRLYFEDAEINGSYRFLPIEKVILANPKPSSFLDYIRQPEDGITTYSSDDFKDKGIRGIKQYWFKHNLQNCVLGNNQKTATVMKPIDSAAKFVGKIRFKNLAEDELGLLLWSLELEDNCYHNIGMGKPYGYGQIKIEINSLNIYDYDNLFSLDKLCMKLTDDKTNMVKEYEQIYKNKLLKEIGKKKIKDIPALRDFFIMKSIIPNDDMTRYMDINKREYSNRTAPLKTVSSFKK